MAFSGVPGSYNAGIVTIYRLDAIEPQGAWVPANKCLHSNTGEDSDFSVSEQSLKDRINSYAFRLVKLTACSHWPTFTYGQNEGAVMTCPLLIKTQH